MNVKELKELLNRYPDDMKILYMCASDYTKLDAYEIKTIKAVDKSWYVMRSHPTMSEENKEEEFLLFPGN